MNEYDGWFWDNKTQDFYRWKDLPHHPESPDVELWPHWCQKENAWIGIEKGKLCPKCGATENSS